MARKESKGTKNLPKSSQAKPSKFHEEESEDSVPEDEVEAEDETEVEDKAKDKVFKDESEDKVLDKKARR